jgi:hypothetical protein
MISVFGQWSGNGLGYFNSTIFNILGYKSSSKQLLLNIVNSIVSAVGAGTAVCLTDKMPRRPVLIYGTLGEFLVLVSIACVIFQLTNVEHSLCHYYGHQRCHLSPNRPDRNHQQD